jgi:hypothetical protein
MPRDKETWIGLVEMKGRPGNEAFGPGQGGAFAIVLALANGPDDYRARVANAASALGLEVVEFDDVEPFAARVAAFNVNPAVRKLARRLTPNSPILFDRFHCYPPTEVESEDGQA